MYILLYIFLLLMGCFAPASILAESQQQRSGWGRSPQPEPEFWNRYRGGGAGLEAPRLWQNRSPAADPDPESILWFWGVAPARGTGSPSEFWLRGIQGR
jgi:hypothetical protein